MKVDEQGREEAHVFRGKVNAETKLSGGGWSAPVALVQGQAFVWKGFQFTVQAAQRSDFPSLNQAEQKPDAAFARWSAFSKELQKRKDLVAYYDFQQDRKESRVLLVNHIAGRGGTRTAKSKARCGWRAASPAKGPWNSNATENGVQCQFAERNVDPNPGGLGEHR